ncbi:putative transcription factor C2H2 family [Helianthus debilis subsp. tardiflorus]
MDTDDTSAVDPTRRCHLCHRILSSETETHGPLESTGICNNCNLLFSEDNITTRTRYNNSLESFENMLSRFPELQPTTSDHVNRSTQRTRVLFETVTGDFDSVHRDGDIFPYDAYDSDSDASVDVDTYLNHDDDDDDDDDDVDDGHDENTVGGSVGRIQLHRSLATNGRNRPNDWLREILSDEGIRNSERRRLFSILDDQVLDTSGYGDYVDVETNGSRLGAPPAAAWFVKNLEPVIVDELGSVCVICKDNVCVGSVVNRLPCGHVYHPSCIVPWLNARNTCPLCRYELPTDDKDRSRQESEVQRALAASGGRRWWFVVAPVVSVVVIVVLWLGGGVFGGQRDDRSIRWWSLFVNE